MTSDDQKQAAQENIKKAQDKWQSMSHEERAEAQPGGEDRAEPGSTGEGDYFRIVIRDKDQFKTFRNQDVGEKGGVQRLAGQRPDGSWDTQAWLIEKKMAEMKDETLVTDDSDVQEILDTYGPVSHVEGDIFEGNPRRDVPESEKPTEAQQQARQENIKKAQEARREQS